MPIDLSKAQEERKAGYPHLVIDGVYGADGGLVIEWVCSNIGFGQLTLWAENDGKLHADTECMGVDFVKAVFRELLRQMKEE